MRRVLAVASVLALVGCGDPVVGAWRGESPTSCGIGEDTVDFVVESDLTGRGSVCNCDFDFRMEPRSDDTYDVDADFGPNCFVPDGRYECTLSLNGEKLDCGTLGEYERAD